MMDPIETLSAALFYVEMDKTQRADVLCVEAQEEADDASYILHPAALPFSFDNPTATDLFCRWTTQDKMELLPLDLSSEDEPGVCSPCDVDLPISVHDHEATVAATAALPRNAGVRLRPPLGAAFIRRSFYYSEYYLPPTIHLPQEKEEEEEEREEERKKQPTGEEGGAKEAAEEPPARRRNCIISSADREALQYMFPVLHHDCVYDTVERFEAHCKTDTHLFLCESEPLFPLQLQRPNSAVKQPEESGLAPAENDKVRTPEKSWKAYYRRRVTAYNRVHKDGEIKCEEARRQWFCALYGSIHTWLPHYLPETGGTRMGGSLNSFVSFYLSDFLAECMVLQLMLPSEGRSSTCVRKVEPLPEEGGGVHTESHTSTDNTEEEGLCYADVVCWTSLLSVVPFVLFAVRHWMAVELAALLAPSLCTPAQFYARYGLLETDFVGRVAHTLSFHIGMHLVSSFRAMDKAERRRACFHPQAEPSPLRTSPAVSHSATAEEEEVNKECCSNTPGRVFLAQTGEDSLKRNRLEMEGEREQPSWRPCTASSRRRIEKEYAKVENMHQLLLLLVMQDRSPPVG